MPIKPDRCECSPDERTRQKALLPSAPRIILWLGFESPRPAGRIKGKMSPTPMKIRANIGWKMYCECCTKGLKLMNSCYVKRGTTALLNPLAALQTVSWIRIGFYCYPERLLFS